MGGLECRIPIGASVTSGRASPELASHAVLSSATISLVPATNQVSAFISNSGSPFSHHVSTGSFKMMYVNTIFIAVS